LKRHLDRGFGDAAGPSYVNDAGAAGALFDSVASDGGQVTGQQVEGGQLRGGQPRAWHAVDDAEAIYRVIDGVPATGWVNCPDSWSPSK
jgi:hypothetical protein